MHREGAEPGSRERAWPGQGGGMRRGAQPHLHLPEIKTRPRRGQGSATGISRGPLHPLLTSPLGARSPHLGQPPVGWWGEAFALFFQEIPTASHVAEPWILLEGIPSRWICQELATGSVPQGGPGWRARGHVGPQAHISRPLTPPQM